MSGCTTAAASAAAAAVELCLRLKYTPQSETRVRIAHGLIWGFNHIVTHPCCTH